MPRHRSANALIILSSSEGQDTVKAAHICAQYSLDYRSASRSPVDMLQKVGHLKPGIINAQVIALDLERDILIQYPDKNRPDVLFKGTV